MPADACRGDRREARVVAHFQPHLDRARARWGQALEAFVGLRVPVDRFAEAFDFGGVKATLRFE